MHHSQFARGRPPPPYPAHTPHPSRPRPGREIRLETSHPLVGQMAIMPPPPPPPHAPPHPEVAGAGELHALAVCACGSATNVEPRCRRGSRRCMQRRPRRARAWARSSQAARRPRTGGWRMRARGMRPPPRHRGCHRQCPLHSRFGWRSSAQHSCGGCARSSGGCARRPSRRWPFHPCTRLRGGDSLPSGRRTRSKSHALRTSRRPRCSFHSVPAARRPTLGSPPTWSALGCMSVLSRAPCVACARRRARRRPLWHLLRHLSRISRPRRLHSCA